MELGHLLTLDVNQLEYQSRYLGHELSVRSNELLLDWRDNQENQVKLPKLCDRPELNQLNV